MLNGLINIKKEQDYTSNDVVAKLRGIVRQKKIGHTGTLDPQATGVLPVCLGNATKLCDYMTEKDKEYVATLRLGLTSDTQDIWGEIRSKADATGILLQQLEDAFTQVQERGEQVPPMYSAISIGGKRLYELAREGKVVERPARKVRIDAIRILSYDNPDAKICVQCGKGTYIRTICADAGELLGCGAVMTSLVRTKVGIFPLEKAHTLDEVERYRAEGRLEELLIPTDRILEEYPALHIRDAARKYLLNGNPLTKDSFADKIEIGNTCYRIYDTDGSFCALYKDGNPDGRLYPEQMFLPDR
ncbi:MAG: tRNA pseudouridine(55) synthase TruB [Lachnospiraceae bacterium]|nr:tRNA pseudouridine(55) synthase TruB [Lachnospiraceae bacterium]